MALPALAGATTKVLIDQVGYDTQAPKQAVVMSDKTGPVDFSVVDADSGKTVLRGRTDASVAVGHWNDRYAIADFSALTTPGHYYIATSGERSWAFDIADNVLERHTLSNVIYYFKGQRSSGSIDKADRALPRPDGKPGTLDLRGGWYDATGDYGIHLSHQNPTNYFNTQQLPLAAWSLLRSWQALHARHDRNFNEYERRLLDEGLFGADFLVRDKRPDGSFWQSIDGPGAGKLPRDRRIGDPNWRTQIKRRPGDVTEQIQQPAHGPHAYEASFRAGGGMAIAALALASRMDADGDFTRQDYLRTAVDAYRFLDAHNAELTYDGKDNIIDDYCALMAASELWIATGKSMYQAEARKRAANLTKRLSPQGYFITNDGNRPFWHAADAGLPIIALARYLDIETKTNERKQALSAIKKAIDYNLKVTDEVANPFGYPRQSFLYKGKVQNGFFIPHENESGWWWQGEDARLGSLAAAMLVGGRLVYPGDGPLKVKPEVAKYASNLVSWVLGSNPYNICMMYGYGHNNVPYMAAMYGHGSGIGGISNGISGKDGRGDGSGIDFKMEDNGNEWRWSEQWIPHTGWFLAAVTAMGE